MKIPYDPTYFPPAPQLTVNLGRPDEALRLGPLNAFVDSGADATLIPVRYIRSLRVPVDDTKYLRSQWGERHQVTTHMIDIGIGDFRMPAVEVIADDRGEELVLGRNVLNKLVITLNGPQRFLEIPD